MKIFPELITHHSSLITSSRTQHYYAERVYAGVLGKIIGVYLGRPFEGWSHRDILEKLGRIEGYVHERLGVPLVVTDDDISGTFTFLRALEDYEGELTAEQIGWTWLNYIVENKTVLWWGGMGMSTEHTAFLRLKHGIKAPESGSIEWNGQVVAEQIGAQIFIDGWGLINPGDPERAAHYARLAGSVSHDGEAIYAAQVVAALVASAFVESDLNRLLDIATGLIPGDCLIHRMIGELRSWHAEGLDWEQGFHNIEERYGYDKYGGNCHVVPNHALVIHALLHSDGDFSKGLMVANTCGWDTDCNSGNVGCILGVRNGLESMADWRGPVADRIFLPTADPGRCITDAASEAERIVNLRCSLAGLPLWKDKDAPRFQFQFPGSVRGFHSSGGSLENAGEGLSMSGDSAWIAVDTFPSAQERAMAGYGIYAAPTLYPGQTVTARVRTASAVSVRLAVKGYGLGEGLQTIVLDKASLSPGEEKELSGKIKAPEGAVIGQVGLEIQGAAKLQWLTWTGTPDHTFCRSTDASWKDQWMPALDAHYEWGEAFRLVQNEGTGLLITGCREWTDYVVESAITPHLAKRFGLAARVQGQRRYYALVLVRGGRLQLVKSLQQECVLAEIPFASSFGEAYVLAIEVRGSTITGYVNGERLLHAEDSQHPLTGGGIALLLTEGRMGSDSVRVKP